MVSTLGKGFVDALKEGVTKSGEKDTKAFAKALDNMQRNVSGVANLFRGSELVSSLVVRDQMSSTVFNSTTGWQIKGDGTATFRSVTVSGGSLLITNTTDRIHLQSDGDAFFGSNIAAPATTSFSIFSNAQTYNSESMGAGDVLFGDNSSGKANLLWDVSAGKILVRGGTTTQGYYDTDGAATFGAGAVTLDADGVTINAGTSGPNQIKWVTGAVSLNEIYGDASGTTPNFSGALQLQAHGLGTSGGGQITILVDEANNGNSRYLRMIASGSGSGTDEGAGFKFTCAADASSNLTKEVFYIERNDVVAVRAAPYGAGLAIYLASNRSPTTRLQAAKIDTYFSTATGSAEDSKMEFHGLNAGTLTERLVLAAAEAVFNEDSNDINLRVEGDTATNLLLADAGLDAVQIGTTTAGAILDARATGVIINDGGLSTVDFTVEGDTETQLLFVDASADKVYYKGTEIATGSGGVSVWQVQMFS